MVTATASPAAAQPTLREALLTLADMPGGWMIDPRGAIYDGKGSRIICGQPIPTAGSVSEAAAGFGQPTEGGASLYQRFIAYPPGGAAAVMADVRARMQPCRGWTETYAAGEPISVRVLPLAVLTLGDDVLAFAATYPSALFRAVNIGVVAVRRGEVIDWVMYIGPNADAQDARLYAVRADARFAAFSRGVQP